MSLLAAILKERVKNARISGKPPALNATPEEIKTETAVVKADVTRSLEMVGISRVFDVEGLWEVLSEISRSSSESTYDGEVVRKDEEETQSQHEVEIADSEDEEVATPPAAKKGKGTADEGIEIIIIDNMTQIINELFSRKEKSDGTPLSYLLM